MASIEIPEKLYRFLEPQWADALVNEGNIRIGTADEYRRMEGDQGDELDSATRHQVEQLRLSSTLPDDRRLMESIGVTFEGPDGDLNLNMTNTQITKRLTGHVLCVSTDPASQAFAGEGKSAIVEITDFRKLVRILTDNSAGQLGPQALYARVHYDDGVVTRDRTPSPPPLPFIKREKFRPEAEFRAFWRGLGKDPAFITNSDIKLLVRKIV
jgi:hypothetical protein